MAHDTTPLTLMLVAASLLLAFGGVVWQTVRQGDANRGSNALLLEATWRCNQLKLRQPRESCLQQYQLKRPADSAGVQALVVAAEASPAGVAAGTR